MSNSPNCCKKKHFYFPLICACLLLTCQVCATHWTAGWLFPTSSRTTTPCMACRAAPSTSLLSRPLTKREAEAANLQLWRPTVSTDRLKTKRMRKTLFLTVVLFFISTQFYISCIFFHHTLLFYQASPLNWIPNLLTRSWRCHMTTWQWSVMRPRPKKATARSASAARAATAWWETSTLTVVDTTGRLWLAGAHGEGSLTLKLFISGGDLQVAIRFTQENTKTIRWRVVKPWNLEINLRFFWLCFLSLLSV